MSIRVNPLQETIRYPIPIGEPGGPCSDSCSCFECQQERHDAARLCPTCGLPLGFGGLLPLEWHDDILFENNPPHSEIIMEHLACYTRRETPPEDLTALRDFRVDFEEVEGNYGN